MKMKLAILALLGLCPLWGRAAGLPQLINYQGYLTGSNGKALETGDCALEFRIYTNATTGSAVWGPQVFDGAPGQGHGAKLSVVQGYFNAVLGPADTNGVSVLSAFTNAATWIGVSTNGVPVGQRGQVLSMPYAGLAGGVANKQVTQGMLADRQTGTNVVGVGGVALSEECVSDEGTNLNTWDYVSDLTVTIETTGRPVRVELVSAYKGNSSSVEGYTTGTSHYVDVRFQIERQTAIPVSSQIVASYRYCMQDDGDDGEALVVTPGTLSHLDTPPAGTHSYRLKAKAGNTDMLWRVREVRLVAYEL